MGSKCHRNAAEAGAACRNPQEELSAAPDWIWGPLHGGNEGKEHEKREWGRGGREGKGWGNRESIRSGRKGTGWSRKGTSLLAPPHKILDPPLSLDVSYFNALHGIYKRSSNENSVVCLSVCPSFKRVDCDKTKEKSVHIFISCER